MSAHLGPLVSALVDEQLGAAARERALAHAAQCDQCAAEIRATRSARGLLSKASGVPELRTDFMSGLVNMAHAQTDQQSAAHISQSNSNPFIPVAEVPKTQFSGDLKQPTSVRQWLRYTAVFGLGGACAAAFLLGSPSVINPVSNTSVLAQRLGVVENAKLFTPETQVSTANSNGALDSIDTSLLQTWLQHNGWSAPVSLPHGVSVQRVGYVDGRESELEIVVQTPAGMVLVSEAKGKLDSQALAKFETIDDHTEPIYVLSSQPAHLVWQSGDTVIELVSQLSTQELVELCKSFEAEGYDTGISARFIRGFSDIAGAISE